MPTILHTWGPRKPTSSLSATGEAPSERPHQRSYAGVVLTLPPSRRPVNRRGPTCLGVAREVFGPDVLDEVGELLDELIGVGLVLELLLLAQDDALGIHQVVGHEDGCAGARGQGDGIGRTTGDLDDPR